MRRFAGFVIIGMLVVAVGIAVAAAYYTLVGDSPKHVNSQVTVTPLTPEATLDCPTPVTVNPIPSRVSPPSTGPRAVLIDEASLNAPNPAFVENVMALLQQGGYTVDYYAGTDVTVDFLRGLPSKGYGMIIIRGHSAALFDDLVLFTHEAYSEETHLDDQHAGRLVEVHWNGECPNEPRYFGVVPKFIESLDGNFNGATVLITGCWGLKPDSMAAAFVDKGANVVVGWDGLVRADHTDQAMQRLLQLMLVEGEATADAVAQTKAEIGPDPDHGSTLGIYPPGG